jgi:transcriptional regulator of arginine metabolism
MSYDLALDGHIRNILSTQEIREQIDLQIKLKERGYDIPQATLSRRLKKLKIVKVAGIYKILDFDTPNLPLVLNMQISESGIIVMHTHPGNANALAAFFDNKYVTFSLDQKNTSGILGTIAGDDTIILIIRSKRDLKNALNIIEENFPYLKHND